MRQRRQIAALGAWCLALALCAPAPLGALEDPGVLLELDRASFAVRTFDLATGQRGPEIPVALGSPATPTPRGDFEIREVVRNPGWNPGPVARSFGAEPHPPSADGPLGALKIPFAGGAIALHGGADPILLGKPVSLGCARATDADLFRLVAWLEERGALSPSPGEVAGELHRPFRRPARIRVR